MTVPVPTLMVLIIAFGAEVGGLMVDRPENERPAPTRASNTMLTS
jgi:hypothetical protein